MENSGVNQYWTQHQEMEWEMRIGACKSFAEKHMNILMRDVLKYDGRSKESRRAKAQARLRIALANDADLLELAEFEVSVEKNAPGWIPGLDKACRVTERLKELKEQRARIKEDGITSDDLQEDRTR